MRRIKKNSVQRLIGFEGFTKYGVRTEKAEFGGEPPLVRCRLIRFAQATTLFSCRLHEVQKATDCQRGHPAGNGKGTG